MAKQGPAAEARAALEQGAKTRLLEASATAKDELLRQYGVGDGGLNSAEVDSIRLEKGSNVITRKKGDSTLKRLMKAFINPFTMVLFALAGISFTTDVMLAASGKKDPSSVIIIVVMVGISGFLQYFQEARSGKAAEKLSEMVKTTIAVRRDGKTEERPLSDIVVGELVVLAAGDMVPADMRILEAKDLFIRQSSLTGESEPVEKFAEARDSAGKDPLGMDNLAFMGSNVVSGSALGMAVNVGDATVFGSIARGLEEKKPLTSFENGIRSVSWVLIRFMLVMVPVVFLLSGLRKGDWMSALLFALSVAVGLTPSMLPTIVATGLARGATSLSRKKVIVKDLGSIQNFGAMDILCTDKTGTLTQDKVTLMYCYNVHGEENERVLRHAFLNSYHQTGLKNLMDVAVLDYAKTHNDAEEWKSYTKVDEVPFDFSRRRMSVVVKSAEGKEEMITKGAIEEMLAVCSHVDAGAGAPPEAITAELRDNILKKVQGYNEEGMRVLGIAHKAEPDTPEGFHPEDECEMVLIGFLAFLDPPKESTTAAVQALRDYGVAVKILTGDNDAVTAAVCRKVGIPVDKILLGADVEAHSDEELATVVESANVFAKLSPQQKALVVAALRRAGHTVGYMGDGINDAAAMKQADVGISVDSAVDIAKESANIILLDKDLMVLRDGIIGGRKTFANITKYIRITVSSNFGNMLSMLAASIFLPFLPMLPIHILVLNLIYDLSCISIPWDNVDTEYLKAPRKWRPASLTRFMVWLGPTGSIFDMIVFAALYFWLCPMLYGGAYKTLGADAQAKFAMLFHTGWFVMSLWTQTLVIHLLRTPKLPFLQSRASKQVLLATSLGILVGTALPYTPIGRALDMAVLPGVYYLLLAGVIIAFIALNSIVKKLYLRRYKELL